MTTTISHSNGVIAMTVMNGYQAAREARTIVHDILDRSDPDVTLRSPGLRRGSFKCVFAEQADAVAAFEVLSIPQVLTLADTDIAPVGMTFVVADGDIQIALDPETSVVWIIEVPFREVRP